MNALATPVSNSFNGGELSPLMMGRADTEIYQRGAELMENFAPAVEGPMQKCPGFQRVRAAAASSSWLKRFVFSSTQAYVMECAEHAARFYTNGGRIETAPDVPYEVAFPYAAGEWPIVSTQQSYDRLYMAHGSYPPAGLSRTSATTFSYAALDLKNGPFKDNNSDETITVSVDATTGTGITITASAPIFQPGHVGALFRIEAADFSDVWAWEPNMGPIDLGYKVRSDGKVYEAIAATDDDAKQTGTVAPTHDTGAEWDGIGDKKGPGDDHHGSIKWQYLYDRFGIVRITGYTSATQVTADVVRRIADSLTSVPSWRWAHGAFSAAEGWPNLVFVWASRLCFWKGFDLYASVAGDYLNHQSYTSSGVLEADLAFRLTLAAEDPPLWVKVDTSLIIGTASKEYAVKQVNPAAGISGENLKADKQSAYGSAPVDPVEAGTAIVFVQRGGVRLREAQYEFGSDKYVSPNLTRWARHITDPAIVQLGQQQMTEELLFGVRSDGQLVLRSYDPEQQIKGFSRRVLAADSAGNAGVVLSAVCIPSDDNSRDDVWALCSWGGAKSVQRMADWWKVGTDIADAYFVDDGLTIRHDDPTDTVNDLGHLIGATVSILADGAVVPPMVVPGSGTITLPDPARVITVGRGYTARYRSLRPEVRDPSGQSSTGKLQRLVNIVLRLLETSGIKVNAGGRDEVLLDRPTNAAMDAPQPLFTGDTDNKSVGGEFGRDGRYEVISDDPRPCFVVAAMPRISVADR